MQTNQNHTPTHIHTQRETQREKEKERNEKRKKKKRKNRCCVYHKSTAPVTVETNVALFICVFVLLPG